MMILHIHNGDASAEVAKQSAIPGEHFAWREALIDGPAPQVNPDQWRRRRAQHLSETYDVDLADCERESIVQEQKLGSSQNYEEVVLWFEHDLFCQVHLIYLLNWFAQHALGETKLSLVCIGSFKGREHFRGLGELTPDEFASLFPLRQVITKEQLALGARAWNAYSSSDPRDIETLLQTDTSSLPYLALALRGHLRRFPSTINGLGLIENRALQIIDSGVNSFIDLFRRFGEVEPVYGLGDSQFWWSLRRLADGNQPLVEINGNGTSGDATVKITDLGRAVMRGEGDFVSLNGIDQWLGGVYLSDERNLWRWDEEAQRIVQS